MKVFVSAKPKAKKEYVQETDEGRFTIAVKEPPKAGKANAAIRRALAEHFGVGPSRVRLTKGFSSREKVFEITDS
jgi:uncharacterized protein (TIGR00251 family)